MFKKWLFSVVSPICLTLLLVASPVFSSAVTNKISALDNTKVDWWLVRSKDHNTPRVNDKLSFDLKTYDAYYVGDTTKPVLYLTFDEGYEKGYTSRILDILKANNVPAVFFVTYPYLDQNPDLINRMVAEGHIVANHSKHHPSMPACALDEAKFNAEIQEVENKYKEITGLDMIKLFRPPMGHYSERSLALTQRLGYKTVFWSFAYADFNVDKQPSHETAQRIMFDNFHNGSIMLLHAVSKTNTEVLDSMIKEAQKQGYTFELFQ